MKRIFGQTLFGIQENKKLLEEGLSVSFGSDYLKKHLIENFGKYILEIEDIPLFQANELKYKYKVPNTLTIVFKNTFKEPEDIQSRLNLFGYDLVKKELIDNYRTLYQFEPRFPILLEKEMLKNSKIFHVTLSSKLDKILQNGLSPRDSQTTFQHKQSRIYLLFTNHVNVVQVLKRKLAADKYDLALSKAKSEEEKKLIKKPLMSVLEIDKEAIDFQRIYLDESFDFQPNLYYSGFTLSNIIPMFLKLTNL